ncbi:MAG: PH domain-containing protein [Proteobacteria bacterium]|nr:PH domain-containing protein [Pseudomonadota bacterium]
MIYVNSILQPGETVRVIGRLHWIVYGRAIALLAAGIVLLIYAQTLAPQIARPVGWIGWGVVVLAALAALQAWFVRWTTELAITSTRVVYKRGFLRRYTVEMNMDKVETVNVEQSLTGRLLDYGSIRVLGSGQGIEHLDRIATPIRLRNAIIAR